MHSEDANPGQQPAAGDGGDAPRGTLLVADRVITLGHGRYRARALVIRGKRVVWVGDDPEQAPPHAERVEFPGCVIGPAFVDAHVHLTQTGITLTGLDLSGATSGRELLHALHIFAEQHTGRIIWGHGFDPHRFPDGLPSADELSQAAAGRAVYLTRVDGHSSLVDRATLKMAPLARARGVERDGDGAPTGVLRREANQIVRRWSVGAMAEADLSHAREAAARAAARLGIASVHEMGGPDIMGVADFDTWRLGSWPVEVVPYWGDADLGFAAERDLRQIGGDLFLDGSLGSHSAALLEPYADRPGSCGELEHDDESLIELFQEATYAGVQVAVHALGDAAVAQAVRCWRAVEAALPDHLGDAIRRLHHRIEHAELLPTEALIDVAVLGLVVSTQPAFERRWGDEGGMYETRLGVERAARTNPYRALADLGIGLAFGSDSNVTPMDPWGGVHAAEHRRHDEHTIDRLEAVSASTLGGRSAARQKRYVGVVRAGMRADLAVFEGNPYRSPDPRDTSCVLTIQRGRRTHGDAPLPAWNE